MSIGDRTFRGVRLKELLRFDSRYFMKFIVLLIVEVVIALYVHDQIIRPYIGDVLVMLLMYTFIKSFLSVPIKKLPIALFVFACVIEVSQLFNLVDRLNLGESRVMRIVLGSTFDPKDILCYVAGMVLLILWEQLLWKNIAYL